MDINTLNEIKTKIPEIINRQREVYLNYKECIEEIIKPNESYIRELFTLILPNNTDFDHLISNAYNNSKIITNIINRYEEILILLNNEDSKVSEHYLSLIFNTLNTSQIMRTLPNNLQAVKVWFEQLKNDDINFQNKNGFINALYNTLKQTENIEKTE